LVDSSVVYLLGKKKEKINTSIVAVGGTSKAVGEQTRVGERRDPVRISFLVPGPPPARFVSLMHLSRICLLIFLLPQHMRVCAQATSIAKDDNVIKN